jgi:hypothetical protein
MAASEGTGTRAERFRFMNENLLHALEDAIQIAWDYLELTGQIDDPEFTSRFLLNTVEVMIRTGERRRLLLSNRAITAYERFKEGREAA